ncbi:ribonuclease H-like domain-containing protein [Staphylotrichum tortipilum]|uniref:Ribonuclease H-like domain-containing protein n=1 Tax=Staphylotrichum tortipilum TaxID=2831512 RepID=A0AAN6MEN3_9PEZI|nr:ribonuclease H-like domain-containing protein [Staphylotrichum longicolle]
MSARKTTHQVWHVSRGIVFAGGSTVVYPRLPQQKDYSTPAAAEFPTEAGAGLPTVLSTTPAPSNLPVRPPAGNAQISTPALAAAANTALAAVAGAAAKGDEGVMTNTTEPKSEEDPKAKEESKPKDTGPILPHFTPLEFKMTNEAFQKAIKAAEGDPHSYWSYDMYRGPGSDGALDAKVKVHYCTSSATTERVIKEHFKDEKILGFDLEWMANASKNATARQSVSLVQLASPSRIGLFHIAAYPQKDKLVAPALKALLEDPDITKLGVSIKADCKRVSQFLGIDVRGQLELSHLYKLVKYCKSDEHARINKVLVSLANQVKEHLGLPLYKGSDVRESDWSKALNMQQIMYSSSDAYAAVHLYAVLDHKRKNLDPVPELPHYAELNKPIPIPKAAPKAATPKASEEQEAEAETAPVEGSADGQAKTDPETEKAIQETLVREDGLVPEAETSLEAAKDTTKTAITTTQTTATNAGLG